MAVSLSACHRELLRPAFEGLGIAGHPTAARLPARLAMLGFSNRIGRIRERTCDNHCHRNLVILGEFYDIIQSPRRAYWADARHRHLAWCPRRSGGRIDAKS